MTSIAREARLVMPELTGSIHKSHDIHQSLRRELCELFGGYTVTIGMGGWVDPDTSQLVQDECWVYDIAMPDEFQYFRQLREIALRYGRLLEQKAVYIRMPGGQVEIVSVRRQRQEGAKTWGPPAHRDQPVGYPGEGISQTALATADAERRLGIKRLPQVGEIWKTASSGKAAVVSRSTVLDGGYRVVLLSGGSLTTGLGDVFAVNLDGKYLRNDSGTHPLDLVSFVSSF